MRANHEITMHRFALVAFAAMTLLVSDRAARRAEASDIATVLEELHDANQIAAGEQLARERRRRRTSQPLGWET